MSPADRTFIVRTATLVIATTVIAVNAVLLIGLFDPIVDNDKIFAILGPSYSTVLGIFVGVLGGARMSK